METNFISSSRLWLYAGAPDATVHNSSDVYADFGEYFFNTSGNTLYICYQGGVSQLWEQITFSAQLSAAISAIQQANWAQGTISAQDYIKNKPTLATVATSGSYNDLTSKPTIPSGQVQSDWTQASTGSVDYIKNKPTARSQSSSSRSLNIIFQVSATRWSLVRYSVDISTTVSLSGSQVGQVVLEMATNAAFTTGVQTIQQFSNGNSGTLVIGLVLTQLNTACLSGDIPAGNYVRLRTVNLTGTPTFTYQAGQEVLV